MRSRLSIILVFWAIISWAIISSATDIAELYEKNKEDILSNGFWKTDEYFIVSGIAPLASESASSLEMAKNQAMLRAERNILFLLEKDFVLNTADKTFPEEFTRLAFKNWLAFYNFNYSVKNAIVLESAVKDKKYIYVTAYTLDSITFNELPAMDRENIYNAFKNNPAKRNEILFIELLSTEEIELQKEEIKNKLAQQYGNTFAIMFLGETVPPVTESQYAEACAGAAELSADATLTQITRKLNKLPYDKPSLELLIKKFTAMGMLNNAEIIRTRLSKPQQPNIIPDPPVTTQESPIQTDGEQSTQTSVNTPRKLFDKL